MPNINVKMLSEDAYLYLKNHLEQVTEKIKTNDSNRWLDDVFPSPTFVDKKIFIPDFVLTDNPNSNDHDIDFENSVKIYESLKNIPSFILSDDRFWLWLCFDKFYTIVKSIMPINSSSTIKDHWMHGIGVRRGLFFGVLSRCYFRVALTVDESKEDKYELSRWTINNPLRFREYTWRNYSSQKHIIRGCIKGEKRALEEIGEQAEIGEVYKVLAKYISNVGSVRLLDAISEEDIEELIYNKAKELFKNNLETK